MIISKFNLFKSEWLELVFAKRNKEYGAYYLRQHYAENINKAMAITFLGVISTALVFGMATRSKPVDMLHVVEVKNILYEAHPPVTPPKKAEVQKAKAAAPKQEVATVKFVEPVITSEPVAVEPPKLIEMQGKEIGEVNIDEPAGKGIPSINDGKGGDGGTAVKAGTGEEVVPMNGVDIEPEPFGGAAAWAKFLQKNLKYPALAIDQQKGGKVWVSFIVEKNGHISSLVVERGAGYGMDEESLRVLKLAPPWKPGLQHGQPVRVKYTLPLNFVMNQDN